MASKRKTSATKKKKRNSSITNKKTILPKHKLYPSSSKKPEQQKRISYPTAAIISTEQEANVYHQGMYNKFTPEQIKSHIPQYHVVPYSSPRSKDPKPLSAARIDQQRSKNILPRYFMNPYQDLDYMVLQDIYANSIGGRIIDRKEELKFGNGVRPVLKLRNPKEHGDDKAQQKLLEDNQEIIDRLLMVDDALGDPDDALDPFLDDSVNRKFQALSKNAAVFGRCMIVKQFTKPLVLADGTLAPSTIPNILKVIHSRDMGIVEIDQESWKLKSVQIRFTAQNILPHQMIYIENGSNNPVYNALHYGFSDMQSMIGASRSLSQMINIDFPTITKHVWAGIGFMFIKPEGTTESQKREELDRLNAVYRAGRLNLSMIDPNDVRVDFQDFNPKINELVSLADFFIRYNIAQTGMPQALFAQEQDSNRSTLVQKIRLFMNGGLKNNQKDDCMINKPVHTSEEFEIAMSEDDTPTVFRSAMQLWASGFKAKKIKDDRIQLSGYFRMIIDPKIGQTWSYVTPRDE